MAEKKEREKSAMIRVSSLTKKYGKTIAVNNVSFSVDEGEIIGILGPNGAGKSTLMNMLTGYISSSYGDISIGGFDLLEKPSEAKKLIGYLPEVPPLYPELTVYEYLSFVYDLKKCSLGKKEHIDEVMDIVKITEVRNRVIRNLSKGYRQRVGLAEALIGNPEILILDEPTAGLDPKEIVEIRNLIKKLGDVKTVLISSHILSEIQSTCRRVIILNRGEILMDADIEELSTNIGPNSRYGVRLTAPEEEVIPVFSSLPGISKIQYVGSFEKGTVDIIVEADKRVDIRKLLFDECAKRNWYILMITPLGVSLEDIFLQIVDKNGKTALVSPETQNEDNEKTTDFSGETDEKENLDGEGKEVEDGETYADITNGENGEEEIKNDGDN